MGFGNLVTATGPGWAWRLRPLVGGHAPGVLWSLGRWVGWRGGETLHPTGWGGRSSAPCPEDPPGLSWSPLLGLVDTAV